MQSITNTIFYAATSKWRASMLAVLIVASTLFSGCGSNSGGPELHPVTGSVTVEGEPVTEGQVTLIPDANSGTRGPSFTGLIGEDGTFSIYGPKGVEGVIPGEYQVVIDASPATHEEITKISKEHNKVLKRSDFVKDSKIPLVYQNLKTTPLKIVVTADQENRYQFRLTKHTGFEVSRSNR